VFCFLVFVFQSREPINTFMEFGFILQWGYYVDPLQRGAFFLSFFFFLMFQRRLEISIFNRNKIRKGSGERRKKK
jgi:hypothetical protein